MRLTRRLNSRYPAARLLTIVLALSLTVMVSLATESKSDITDSMVDLVTTCDPCSSPLVSNPNNTLN